MDNLFVTAIKKGQEALAAQQAAGIAKHQWARNILPMHKLVILAFLIGDAECQAKNGLTLRDILSIIQSLGQRVTYSQLAVTLGKMREYEILDTTNSGNAHTYRYQMVSKLNLSHIRH